jgi:hypothetical protein
MRATILAAAIGCAAVAAGAGTRQSAGPIYKELVMSTDRTIALVSPTSGLVTQNFLAWLVNSGQQAENIECGVSDSSTGASYSFSARVSNSIGPGQTATVTITLRGTGNHFPYWIDCWAEIQGATSTRKSARLAIDTIATGVRPKDSRMSTVPGVTLTVLRGAGIDIAAPCGARLEAYNAAGRLTARQMIGQQGHGVMSTGRGLQMLRLDGAASSARPAMVR